MNLRDVQPLCCAACGKPVQSVNEWVRETQDGPIYGLHEDCLKAGASIVGWAHSGRPLIHFTQRTLEQRVAALERLVQARGHYDLQCEACRRGDPLPHHPVYRKPF